MELLLNLVWLLLAVPAYRLWRASRNPSARGKLSALQALLALGCVLVVLFPIISATDDLCAMRTEMEENSSSRRSARQACNEKASAWNVRLQSPATLLETQIVVSIHEVLAELPPGPAFHPSTVSPLRCFGRAPPQDSVG
jgi:hypothetical protein